MDHHLGQHRLQLPALREALADPNAVVRYWGALGCSMLGSGAAPAIEDLSAHLDDADEDRWVRVQCADALARAGEVVAAIGFLAELATDAGQPFPIRLQAVRSLAMCGPAAVTELAALSAAASDPNEYVAAAAAHAVAVVDGTYAPAP